MRQTYAAIRLLLGVEVDDELLVDGLGDVATLRIVDELAAHACTVPLEPRVVVGARGQRVDDYLERFAAFANRHHVAFAEAVRRDVHHVAVDGDVAVRDQLAGLGAAAGYAETVDHIVEAGLDEFHQLLTGDAAATGGFGIEFAELTLEDAIGVFGFLLLVELDSVFRDLAAATVLTVHAGGIGFLLIRFVRAIDRLVEFSCNFGLRTCVSCHFLLLLNS